MDEQAIVASLQRVLAEHYGQSECTFHSLNTRSLDDASIVYKMYRVDLSDHSSWVISAAHDQIIDSHTFRWELQGTATAWLEARARLLMALAHQRYPAPEVILALSGACVVKSGAWSMLVTSWITGPNSQFQPEPLSQAGALLARLHLLPVEAMPLQPARWNSSYSIPHALEELERVASCLPFSHQAFYQECYDTLRAVLRLLPTLPEVLIHGDGWMQNAVVTDTGTVFIDWEGAGRGAALLDLADFLFRGQCNAYGAPPDALLPENVTAAVSGYASQRTPNDDELDLLAIAMRFSCVWSAAWMFARGRAKGWTPRLEQGLVRAQTTYELAEPTAHLARSAFQGFRTFVT